MGACMCCSQMWNAHLHSSRSCCLVRKGSSPQIPLYKGQARGGQGGRDCHTRLHSEGPWIFKLINVDIRGRWKGMRGQPECSPKVEMVVENVLSNFWGSISWGEFTFEKGIDVGFLWRNLKILSDKKTWCKCERQKGEAKNMRGPSEAGVKDWMIGSELVERGGRVEMKQR